MKNDPIFKSFHSDADLRRAASAGIMPAQMADELIAWLAASKSEADSRPDSVRFPPPVEASRFNLSHFLLYGGALILMASLGLLATDAFAQMSGLGFMIVALLYGAIALVLGAKLWLDTGMRTPAGLFLTIAVAMVPMFVYGLQKETGLWTGGKAPGIYRNFFEYVRAGFVPMEISTILAGFLIYRRWPFGFIAFPIAVALWYLSMDLAAWNSSKAFDFDRNVTIAVGVALAAFTLSCEQRPQSTTATFWLWLAAATAIWSGLAWTPDSMPFDKFLFFLFNLGFLGFALFVRRAVFAVYGVIGVLTYLGWLAFKLFRDSLAFPFVLSLVGLLILGIGIVYARHREAFLNRLSDFMPPVLRRIRPARLR